MVVFLDINHEIIIELSIKINAMIHRRFWVNINNTIITLYPSRSTNGCLPSTLFI